MSSERQTRAVTGNSKPRVFEIVEAAVKKAPSTKKRATTTKKTGTKANTSKPRTTKVAADKVKKPAPKKKTSAVTAVKKAVAPKKATGARAAPHHKPTMVEKVQGAVLKAQGAITGQTGKKAAGTAKMRGTDGKKGRPLKTSKA